MSLHALLIWLGFGVGIVLFATTAGSREPAYVQSEVWRHAPVVQPPPPTQKPRRVVREVPALEQAVSRGCFTCGMG